MAILINCHFFIFRIFIGGLMIEKYKSYKTLPEKEVDKLVKQFENVFETMVPILFIDTSLLTEKSKDRLIREKVIILDIKNITKMLNKRDMIMEILKN